MKKTIIALVVACFLSATTAAPVFADRGGRYYYEGDYGFDPLWPVAAALAIPAAIIGTLAQIPVPVPVQVRYATPPAPIVYSRPYYAPQRYYAPQPYYSQRDYPAPRGYRSQRPYYPDRYYR